VLQWCYLKVVKHGNAEPFSALSRPSTACAVGLVPSSLCNGMERYGMLDTSSRTNSVPTCGDQSLESPLQAPDEFGAMTHASVQASAVPGLSRPLTEGPHDWKVIPNQQSAGVPPSQLPEIQGSSNPKPCSPRAPSGAPVYHPRCHRSLAMSCHYSRVFPKQHMHGKITSLPQALRIEAVSPYQ
jgi:hypothetical protein